MFSTQLLTLNYLLPDKFGYSHHQFAGSCMNIMGRTFISITYGN